jgi:hypothetical protein
MACVTLASSDLSRIAIEEKGREGIKTNTLTATVLERFWQKPNTNTDRVNDETDLIATNSAHQDRKKR